MHWSNCLISLVPWKSWRTLTLRATVWLRYLFLWAFPRFWKNWRCMKIHWLTRQWGNVTKVCLRCSGTCAIVCISSIEACPLWWDTTKQACKMRWRCCYPNWRITWTWWLKKGRNPVFSIFNWWIRSSSDNLDVAAWVSDVVEDDDDREAAVACPAEASCPAEAALNEAALAERDDAAGVETKDFATEVDFSPEVGAKNFEFPDPAAGPRTGARGGRGGGESAKTTKKMSLFGPSFLLNYMFNLFIQWGSE